MGSITVAMPSDELTTELVSSWTTVAPSAMVTSETISIATGVDGADGLGVALGVRVGLVGVPSGSVGTGVAVGVAVGGTGVGSGPTVTSVSPSIAGAGVSPFRIPAKLYEPRTLEAVTV